MKSLRTIFALVLALLVVSVPISASEYQGGTQSPLRFGVGARELALGGSAIVGCEAATAPFWNAARLASAEYLSFTGFHTQLFESEVTYQYAGLAWPTLDFGTLGFGIQRLGISDIERRDSENMLTGHFSDERYGFRLAYGTRWGSYQLGIAIGLEQHSLDSYTATSSPGVDISLMKSFGPIIGFCRDFDAVLITSNVLGSSTELYQESSTQPVVFDAGLNVGLFPSLSEQHSVDLYTKLTKVDNIDLTAAVGLEYTYATMLDIRCGLRGTDWSIGAGIEYKRFSFDYALVERELGVLHMFSLTSSFGSSTKDRRRVRAEQRETDFQNRMQEQLTQKNRTTIDELVKSGQSSMESGNLANAVDYLDRALFIARSSSIDTVSIASLLTNASNELNRERQFNTHNAYLDSARHYLESNDAVTAQYYANLAQSVYPESTEAATLKQVINHVLDESATRERMVEDQIRQIDSLLTYGQYEAAVTRTKSLAQIVPGDSRVASLLKRARFGILSERGDRAFANSNYDLALAIVNEAETLFPEHQWCTSLRKRVADAKRAMANTVATSSQDTKRPLSDNVRNEVEDLYRDGQVAFDKGMFEDAIESWERIELLDPDYSSVRQYLVEAYKYLGVEHYGNNELEQALALWRRATELMPGNQEILSYIRRTEAEITKIRELTYEQ
jgi:tetratricopeptide (TPR) repeat protein